MIPASPPARVSPEGYRPCVGVVLARADGLVWAGRRADRHGSGPEAAWQLPQGGVDAGESLPDAALRELHEETGLPPRLARVEAVASGPTAYDVPPDLLPAHWAGRWRGQSITWVLARFLGTDADVDTAGAHQEFANWRWAPLAEVADGVVAWKRAAYARAIEEFGDRLGDPAGPLEPPRSGHP